MDKKLLSFSARPGILMTGWRRSFVLLAGIGVLWTLWYWWFRNQGHIWMNRLSQRRMIFRISNTPFGFSRVIYYEQGILFKYRIRSFYGLS